MDRNRLEAFSDGVFAFAITLLILDVRVPREGELSWSGLVQLAPQIAVFVLSFVLVGVYWVAHNVMMQFAGPVDRRVLWSNLGLLLTIVFIPLPAATLGTHTASPVAAVFYGAMLALCNAAGASLWIQATRHLAGGPLGGFRRFIAVVHSAPILAYALGAAVSFVSIPVALVIYACVPAFFILPNPIVDRRVAEAFRVMNAVPGAARD